MRGALACLRVVRVLACQAMGASALQFGAYADTRAPTNRLAHKQPDGEATTNIVGQSVDENVDGLKFRLLVLNLDRRRDRLQRQTEDFHAQDLLTYSCRISALDAQNLSAVEDFARQGYISEGDLRSSEDGGSHPSLTDIAIYGSHVKAWKMIAADTSIDFGVIAEDDLAHFSENFSQHFAKIWKHQQDMNIGDLSPRELWEQAGWIYLQVDGYGWPKGGNRDKTGTVLREITGEWPKNTAMYAVSRAGAEKLVQWHYLVQESFDSYIPTMVPGLRFWTFQPPIAQALASDEPGGDSDHETLLSKGSESDALLEDCPSVVE